MNVESLDLNLLRVLDALLQERHITRAAGRVGLSQAATSHALARLRRAFGDRLLVRVGREMQLTPEARRLAPVVERVMHLLTEELAAPEFDPRTSRAALTLTVPDFLAPALLPELVAVVRAQAPGVTVTALTLSATSVGTLRAGTADAVVLPATRVPPATPSWPVGTVRWSGVAAAGNAQVAGPVTLDDLCAMPHLVVERGMVHELLDDLLAERGMRRQVVVTISNSELLASVLAGTELVTIGWSGKPPGPRLRHFALPPEVPPIDYHMAWSPRLAEDPASQWFRGHVARITESGLRGRSPRGRLGP